MGKSFRFKRFPDCLPFEFYGAGFGITTTTYGTVFTELIRKLAAVKANADFQYSGTIAMALGPLIGLWLMQAYNLTIFFYVHFHAQ